MSLQEEEHLGRYVDQRAWERARRAAFGEDGFVDQHGFMRAGEILALAARAGVGPGTTVLDLCCGAGGPGRLVAGALGCDYLGVDASADAVRRARERDGVPGVRFQVHRVPPVPAGPFDVVLLLETLLAFRDKETLLRQVVAALGSGGRFACSAEVGPPLTPAERAAMPAPGTVWPVPLPELLDLLDRVGLEVTWAEEVTAAHLEVVDALLTGFTAHEEELALQVGRDVLDETVTAHRLWSAWLHGGRVRKHLLVARRRG